MPTLTGVWALAAEEKRRSAMTPPPTQANKQNFFISDISHLCTERHHLSVLSRKRSWLWYRVKEKFGH